jgi:hypothetical protein
MSFNANCIWPRGSEVLLITPSGGVPMVRTAFAEYGAVRQIEEFVGGAICLSVLKDPAASASKTSVVRSRIRSESSNGEKTAHWSFLARIERFTARETALDP